MTKCTCMGVEESKRRNFPPELSGAQGLKPPTMESPKRYSRFYAQYQVHGCIRWDIVTQDKPELLIAVIVSALDNYISQDFVLALRSTRSLLLGTISLLDGNIEIVYSDKEGVVPLNWPRRISQCNLPVVSIHVDRPINDFSHIKPPQK